MNGPPFNPADLDYFPPGEPIDIKAWRNGHDVKAPAFRQIINPERSEAAHGRTAPVIAYGSGRSTTVVTWKYWFPPEQYGQFWETRPMMHHGFGAFNIVDAATIMSVGLIAGYIAAWVLSIEAVGSPPLRRPKKRGPFQLVPVMARAMVERLA
jgi:hypothetical protein